jgi:hypothetical protein
MTVTSFHETRHPAEFILAEEDAGYNRSVITIASGAGILAAGTVLGKITASGKYVPSLLGATDGSQVAVAINIYGCDATSADQPVTALVRGPCSVNVNTLTYGSDRTTSAYKAAANANLLTYGIKTR